MTLAKTLRELAGAEPHPLRDAHLESALIHAYRDGKLITVEESEPKLTFAPQTHPGGRILLMLGQHQIGAVFPPAVSGDKTDRHPWTWRFWLTTTARDGRSKTELGARNDLLAQARDWLRKAGIASA